MTAISGKYKNKIIKKLKISNYDAIRACICLFIGFCAGRSRWCDATMSATAVILARSAKDMVYRYAVITGALVSSGMLAIRNIGYIPYFLCFVVLAVGSNFIRKNKYILVMSLSALAVAKTVLVYFNMPFSYKLFPAVEAVAVYIIAQIVSEGITHCLSGKNIHSFTDAVFVFISISVVAVALSGIDSHWLYPGFSLALAASWYYISTGRLQYSLISLLAAALVAIDKQGFIYLFIAAGVLWGTGCYLGEKLSMLIYPVTALTAFITNILFISEFNSFALTGSSVMALIIYTALPYIAEYSAISEEHVFTSGRDWRLLMLSMKKLENSLDFLAGCAIDISRLNEKNLQIESLEDMVAQDVCRNCEKNTYCWQEKYSFTRQQFSEYSKKMYWTGENRFSTGFCTQCINTGDVIKSFEENSRLLLSKKYILQSQKNNQKLLQSAFLSISSAVGDLIYQNQQSYLLNTTITMETDRFLNDLGINHTYCLCSQNPDQASFAVLQPIDDKNIYKIQNHLEKLYSVRFLQPRVEKQGIELLYIFNSCPVYEYETAMETSRYKRINGDNREVFTRNGKVYIVLSDGMGTGPAAAAESHTVIAMAKSLITTGVSMKNTVNIINLAMNLKGTGETSASVDILETDLFTGRSTITKAGAGVSIVLDKNGVTRYYQDSLPLGILKEVKPVQSSFTLSAGDTVILMSDGAGVVSGKIRDMYSETCGRISRFIIEENKTQDDKTVVALRLKIAV